MIGVDTNILVRYFVSDDPAQVPQSANRGIRLYVDDVVLCELVWVLRSSYKLDRDMIAAILEDMLTKNQFSFDDRQLRDDVLFRILS